MPYKDKEIEKMYFSISEVAKQFNVAASLIRFWETEFEILIPPCSPALRLRCVRDLRCTSTCPLHLA